MLSVLVRHDGRYVGVVELAGDAVGYPAEVVAAAVEDACALAALAAACAQMRRALLRARSVALNRHSVPPVALMGPPVD